MTEDPILVVNAGSSSVKAALFSAGETALLAVNVLEVGGAARIRIGSQEHSCAAPDHEAAIRLILEACEARGFPVARLSGAGHRIVHGGPALTQPVILDEATIGAIEACVPIAPLHNPHNLAAIRAMRRRAPDVPQVAVFDTAFHATNPEVALRYAIPASEAARGLRRYGFHGISYASLTVRLPMFLGGSLPARLLAFHLGNGASLCAIREGRSVASSMGYSPLDGLTMGTRSGQIDGNAVLRLAAEHGIEGAARILNHESGLLALGGASDMRELHAADTPEARFAIAHFCYWAVRHAGSAIAAMGGLDAIAFTGGIGENDPEVRAHICAGLGFLGVTLDAAANAANAPRIDAGGLVPVVIVPAAEEAWIAAETRRLIREDGE